MMSVPHMQQNNQLHPQSGQNPSARSQMNSMNQQFLQEIGQIAQELHQQAPNQQVRQQAQRINQLVQQLQYNQES